MNQLYRISQVGIGIGVALFHAVAHEEWSIESAVPRNSTLLPNASLVFLQKL
jgi:hypothetical protein